jgi:hypothetical protein
MDPITLAILGATAGTAISQLPNIIPSKFEREQKKRMQALQRKEEMGLLGLTDKERAALEGRLESKSTAAADFAAQERQRALAGMGQGVAGASLLEAQVADEQLRSQNTAINQAIAEQDLAKEQAQIDEVRALEAAQGEFAARRAQGIASIGAAGVEAGFSSAAQQKIIQGATTPSQNSVSAIAQLYGISDDQARGLIEISAKNPEALSLYRTLNANPTTTTGR